MIVEFQYLAPEAEIPDNITFSDAGFDFEEKAIPCVGDHIILPYNNDEGEKNYKMVKVLSRIFWADGANYSPQVHDRVIVVVSDRDNSPETNFRE